MRLIDADRIYVIFRCAAKLKQNQITGTTWSTALNEAADKIDEAPTIDAVEVVRCKDCKYYDGEYSYCANERLATPDDYCSLGKKRDEDAD